MKINEVSTVKYIICLIMIYTVSTLNQGLIPFSINRICIFSVLILLIMSSFNGIKKRRLIIYFCLMFYLFYFAIVSLEIDIAIKDWIYFGFTLIFLDFISNKKNFAKTILELKNNEKWIKKLAYLLLLETYIAVILPQNYQYAWGEGTYFIGFARDTHVMASSLCLFMSILYLIFSSSKFEYYKVFILLSVAGIVFATGARTYIVPAVIINFLYIKENLKNTTMKIIMITVTFFLITYIFFNSGMYEKFLWSSNASNQYAANSLISSTGGRAAFWVIDIREYLKLNPLFMLIGKGFDYVYYVNKLYYNMHIWAHNDLIQLLLGTGVVGIILYLRNWLYFVKMILKNGLNRLTIISFVLYIFFPMIFNGLFTYQHYFFSVIIMGIALVRKNIDNEKAKLL